MMKNWWPVFLGLGMTAALIMADHAKSAPAERAVIGVWSTRTWSVCPKIEDAEANAKLALESFEGAYFDWEDKIQTKVCEYRTEPMMPQQVVFKVQTADHDFIKVVRVADLNNVETFWVTMEPVTGE